MARGRADSASSDPPGPRREEWLSWSGWGSSRLPSGPRRVHAWRARLPKALSDMSRVRDRASRMRDPFVALEYLLERDGSSDAIADWRLDDPFSAVLSRTGTRI